MYNVVEAHCYDVDKDELIWSMYVTEWIPTWLQDISAL